MIKTLKHMANAIELMRLPSDYRQIVFYSEGLNYWPIFEGLINEIFENSDLKISYVTSGADDPGLGYVNSNYKSFLLDEAYVRNWFFENLDADVVLMTMPDLNQYQVKRSKHKVHYIYIQHALMSMHMAYRHGAFDWYDTIFCAGPHHVNELRSLEKKYDLPRKELFEHGYSRLDRIIEGKSLIEQSKNNLNHALFAPSWGENASIESGLGEQIIEKLLAMGYFVTLRPHPETWKSSTKLIKNIIKKYSSNKMFNYDQNVGFLDSFHNSDFMISDWSGAALEYSFGLSKPVIFIDLPKKINNPNFTDIDDIPLEVSLRNEIGLVSNIDDLTTSLISSLTSKKIDAGKYFYNIGESDKVGAKYIMRLIKNRKRNAL